ncbi:MAG: TIGR00730 family Rossman fold protein [Bauldia litoralis]
MEPIASVCVYCGARFGDDPVYKDAAETLGREMAARSLELVFGGGNSGLMGAISDAARAAGGKVTGIIPRDLKQREIGGDSETRLVVVDNMHERKMMMARLADAFVVLPGGLGTLDETFEIVTWRQLGFHDKPIVIADIGGYWAPLRNAIDSIVSHGFADPVDGVLLEWTEDIAGVFALLERARPPSTPLDTRTI